MPLQVINVVYLGRVDYATALELQRALVHLVKAGRTGHTLLLLEHPPVITLGRNAREDNVVASRDFLTAHGIELFETDRGGDVTFHGPGQLVGYPIFDLRGFIPRIRAVEFVRRMEEALIRTCGDLGVVTQRIAGLTGVWTQNEPAAKIAAIGVHISRGVTSHGFALNVNTNLDYFKLIVPCGISDKPVTSLQQELDHPLDLDQVAQRVSRNFGRVFDRQMLPVNTVDELLGRSVDIPAKAPTEVRTVHGDD